LTGNIASGKSSIGQRLENLGAGLLNCDILAHSVYRKGEPCYESIVQHFGKEILDDRGEVNRKALGEIVFNCKVLELAYCRQTGFYNIRHFYGRGCSLYGYARIRNLEINLLKPSSNFTYHQA
jgi:hypothetical protein